MQRLLLLRPPPGGLPGLPEGLLLWQGSRVCLIPLEHRGILISHVDDLLWGGEEEMQAIAAKLREEFRFGTWDCGRKIMEGKEGIHVSCPNTAANARGIFLSLGRSSDQVERSQLRSVLGSLHWLVRVCRPDICYQVMKEASADDLIQCNQLLDFVKATPERGMYFPYGAMDIESATILSITDASHAADYDTSKPPTTGESWATDPSRGGCWHWPYRSSSMRAGDKSTCSAQLPLQRDPLGLSLYAAGRDLVNDRRLRGGRTPEWRPPGHMDPKMIEAMDKHRVTMLTDCKSLEEHAKQPGLRAVNDKRLAVDLCGVRQVIWRQEGEEVSDPLFPDKPPQDGSTQHGLTKLMRSPQLDELMHKATMGVSFVKIGHPKSHP